MISKAAILERAKEWQLTPEVVEKDYVLGWFLAGLALSAGTAETWVFKGGTCLKKCILETYRFSEDLDFSLLPNAAYDADALLALLINVAARVTELSGIQFPAGEVRVLQRRDLSGNATFEGRVGYVGPLAVPGPPKIRFDLTRHEPVLRPVENRAVTHPYPDDLPAGLLVRCYSLSELVAEKARALCERARPRDLYDVVLLGTVPLHPDEVRKLRDLAREKFAVKKLPLPSVAEVCRTAEQSPELRSEWENMLGHQLPAVPPVDEYLRRLPDAIRWLDEPAAPQPVAPAPLRSAPHKPNEQLVATPGIRVWGVGAPLEAVRFAGSSRLLVEFRYHGATRRVEPYSLRRPKTGNLLLYGYERLKNGVPTEDVRAYKVAELEQVRVTNEAFQARYAIELIEQAGVWRW